MADPVDTQNLFSKTVHVQKLQQTQLNQAANEQEGFADQMRKTARDRESQVQGTQESQMHKTEDQQEENKQQAEARARKRTKETEKEKDQAGPADTQRGRIIDVEI